MLHSFKKKECCNKWSDHALCLQARDYMIYLSLLDVFNRNDQIPLQAYSEVAWS
jgi:hypothetical protein